MMTGTELTFARISKGGVAEDYLFAHTPTPFRKGEITSDFLCFFGFTSGNFQGTIVTQELANNLLLLFPVEDNYVRDTSLLQHLFDTLGHEFYIEPTDIKRGFRYLAAAHGKDFTKNLELIQSIGESTKPHLHPLFTHGAHMDGRRFFAVGFTHALEEHPFIKKFVSHFNIKTYPITEFPYFKWDCWTGLNSHNKQHVRGIFGGLKRLHFMASTHELQKTYLSNLENEAMRLIDYVG